MKVLRKGERCPIHRSYFCCGRNAPSRKDATAKNKVRISDGVWRVTDLAHPRGYREICSRAELRRRKHELLAKNPACWICEKGFADYRDVQLEHKEPKGMGGAKHDDHRNNLALAHGNCNFEKGSKRIEAA